MNSFLWYHFYWRTFMISPWLLDENKNYKHEIVRFISQVFYSAENSEFVNQCTGPTTLFHKNNSKEAISKMTHVISFWFDVLRNSQIRARIGPNLWNRENVEHFETVKSRKRSTWSTFRSENERKTIGSKVWIW